MSKYRSAIIGCGGRAYGHANAYQQVLGGELVACANRSDVARREKFAETFSITGYADAEQMLRTEQPDLVHLVAMPDQWRELMPMVSENWGCRRASLKNRLPAVWKIGVFYMNWRRRPLQNSALANSTDGIPTSPIADRQ